MKDRAWCKDCKWFWGNPEGIEKYHCDILNESVRAHWLACGGFEEREKGGDKDEIDSHVEKG